MRLARQPRQAVAGAARLHAMMLAGVAAVLGASFAMTRAVGAAPGPVQQPTELGVLAVASDQTSEIPQAGARTAPQTGSTGSARVPAPPVDTHDPEVSPPHQAPQDTVQGPHEKTARQEKADAVGGPVTPNDRLPASRSNRDSTARRDKPRSAASSPVPRRTGGTKIEPASFQGIKPGKSTVKQIIETWGQPPKTLADADGAAVYVYSIGDFPRVQVRLVDDMVASIVIDLGAPIQANALTQELDLTGIRTVDITGLQGRPLGRAFPERGVVFGYAPEAKTADVQQVILEPIAAEPFVLRVESHLHGPYRANFRDLDFVVGLEPDSPRPYWLRARMLLAVGQLHDAEYAAASAVGLAPDTPAYRLTWAVCLLRTGRYDDAVEQVDRVLAMDDLPPAVEARALLTMGDLLAASNGRVAKADADEQDSPSAAQQAAGHGAAGGQNHTAMDFHVRAIKRATASVGDPSLAVRRMARETRIDAYLATACDIAWGHWQRKNQVVPQWIDRALREADRAIRRGGGSQELRLRVAERALLAHAGVRPPADPQPWVATAERAAAAAVREADDPLWTARLHRQLGMVYYHAMTLAHARGQVKQGLRYGQRALDDLAFEADPGPRTPTERFLLGQLYFQMGALLAVHRQDHFRAVQWYDKAVPLLRGPTPVSAEANPRRHGDVLVSMGVSYWEVDQRDKAVELTTLGANIIRQAVAHGAADASALAVPYGNLATMHEVLGDAHQARRFAKLARRSR